MRKKEIATGKIYWCKVSGNMSRCIVNRITDFHDSRGRALTYYDCLNMETGRAIVVKSSMRFRSEYRPALKVASVPRYEKQAGHLVNVETGKAVAPGVVCKCGAGFCPMHGRTVPTLTAADLLKAEVVVAQEQLRLQQGLPAQK